jgi:hypothetical protein
MKILEPPTGTYLQSVPFKSGFIIHNIKQNGATRKADKEVKVCALHRKAALLQFKTNTK